MAQKPGQVANSARPAPGPGRRRRTQTRRRAGSARVLLFNKPFGVLCQFTDARQTDGCKRPCLADFISEPGIYAAGRLDRDSEGLLLLTDDGRLQQRISDPVHKLPKRYLVQVEGQPDEAALGTLRRGVMLKDGMTAAAGCEPALAPAELWPRNPPVRYRAQLPTSWLSMTLREGRNRQVRRMTAAVGFPTLRLIRTAIGPLDVWSTGPGEWRWADAAELASLTT